MDLDLCVVVVDKNRSSTGGQTTIGGQSGPCICQLGGLHCLSHFMYFVYVLVGCNCSKIRR